MAMNTCMGGMMMCTFGLAPSSIIPTPKPIMTSNMVAANIMDNKPMVNIMPFGLCSAPTNPLPRSGARSGSCRSSSGSGRR